MVASGIRAPHLAALFALAACAPPPAAERAARGIIDGSPEDGHPAVGALVVRFPGEDPGGSFCSATLIEPGWVLTAAHCVNGRRGRPPEGAPPSEAHYFHFFIGADTGEPGSAQLAPVRQIHVHPSYEAPGGDRHYDIALLELEAPVDGVAPYPIFRGDLDAEVGADVLYVGFGQSNPDGGGSGRKRSATLRLASTMPAIYVTEQAQGGVCFGDSGGPGLLDVGGALQVIGVNSTVFGGSNCMSHSTQIRVDAYQTWIDAVMGGPSSCLDEASLCQCPQACGSDGVCDNATCGQPSCGGLLTCFRFCRDQTCAIECILKATPEAGYLYAELVECANELCPDGRTSCIEARCRRQQLGCAEGLDAVTGDLGCPDVQRCVAACALGDLACVDACFYEGTLEAQGRVAGIEACQEQACAGAATRAELAACLAESCRAPLLACLPSDGCRLVGGSCGEGEACVPEAWGASYCRPSTNLGLGEACAPGQADCADGAVCVDAGEGPRCHQACTSARDCDAGYAPCAPAQHGDAPLTVGVCSLACADADGDRACDAADCAPLDAAIHPGAEEVCDAEGVDEDCDGVRNEGCLICPDGSPGPDCGPGPVVATEPPEEGGCACAAQKDGPAWLALLLVLPLALRPRRLLALLGLLAGCGGADGPPPDGGVTFLDGGYLDAGWGPLDGGRVPDPEPSVFAIQQGLVEPGRRVELSGLVVTSPMAGGFYVSDGAPGPYHGLWVALEAGVRVEVGPGDGVEVSGLVHERAFGDATRTELRVAAASDVRVAGRAPLPEPQPIRGAELAIDDVAALYEGTRVTLPGGALSERIDAESAWLLDGLVRVEGLFVAFDLAWLEPGTRLEGLSGIVHLGEAGYALAPTDAEGVRFAPADLGGCMPLEGYLLCTERRRWPDARRECGARGGRLVVLETQEENLRVGGLVRQFGDADFWIGVSDRETEGEWLWVDGSTLAYDPWSAGEPNDHGSGEDCAESNWRGDGVWNDANCGSRQQFVCEVPGAGARCAGDADCAAGPAVCVDGSCVPE